MFGGISTAYELSAVCPSRPVTETRDETWSDETWSNGLTVITVVLAGGFADRVGFDGQAGVSMPARRRSIGEP